MKNYFFLFVLLCFFSANSQETAEEFQQNLNLEYADKAKSPLTDEDFKHFKSLDSYPINEKFIVDAKFVRTKKEKVFKMKTSTSRTPDYIKYGELTFTMNGSEYKLNIYQSIDLMKKPSYEDYLFLPFSDLTNGKETYIGGRYMDMRIQKGNNWKIDFNQSYNPYCAYNYKFSCPKVPMENDLDVEILAGVKKFHD